MPKSKERWEYISNQIAKFNLDCERAEGIDISTLSQSELDKYYSFENNKKMYPRVLSKGEIGCYIAHIKCWEKLIEENLDFAIILEDDIFIDDKFPSALEFLLNNLDKWNFIRLQVEHKSRFLYQQENFGDFSILELIRTSGSTWGYALNGQTAQKLISKILPFGITADTNMHIYHKYGITVKTLVPPIVFIRANNDSEIFKLRGNKKQRNFYPFARQVFSFKAYIGRFKELIKRDGLLKFLSKIIRIKKYKFLGKKVR